MNSANTAMRRCAVLGALVLAAPAAALAQATGQPVAPAEGPATALDAVTSTATRAARPIGEVPATVTVIDAEQLQRQNAVRPQDAIRYEPGVSFSNQPLRGGGGNFVIRGIGGNRVLVLTDGVRLPDFPESNLGAGTFTRDFVDLETVRRIEIVRGPASALYGSDAIGGVVNYILKDPADFLGSDRNAFLAGRFGFSGADTSFTESVIGAARQGPVEAMLLYTRRDGQELTPNGRLTPNPQVYSTNSVLGRAVVRPSAADTVRLTGEVLSRSLKTDVLTERGTTPGFGGGPSTTTQSSIGDDTTFRGRVQGDWFRTAPLLFADSIEVRTYYAFLNRREITNQGRYVGFGNPATTPSNRLRYTNTQQDQSLAGIDAQFRTAIEALGTTHRLTYGVSVVRTETSRPRDRFEANLQTRTITTTVAGESFPNKNFPDTSTWQTGLYLQDEFTYGAVDFLPALRLDWYTLRTHPDADFRRSAQTGIAAAVGDTDAFAVSPKFGVTWRIDRAFSLYGQYARGFRAPPYDTASFGFTNRVFGYQILPNADLEPEYANSFEAGFRGRFPDGSSFQVAGFYNRYENFIDTQVIGFAGGLQQFQYRNIGSVEIAGIEARGEWRISPAWATRGALAYAKGENLDAGTPLDGVDPLRGVLGVAWRAPGDGRFAGLGAELNLTGALRNTRVSSATFFSAPAYAVLDLAAHYDLGDRLSINVGLFNVTNTKYFLTADTIGLSRTSPLIDLYAQPGRYAAVNLTARF
jgi:hemoglobin/transferrin/lactoferrin receptor protein